MRLGLLARYRSAGGSLGAFALSKLLCVLVLAVPALGVLLAVFQGKQLVKLAALGGALLLCAFCLMLCLAVWAWEEERTQRWGICFCWSPCWLEVACTLCLCCRSHYAGSRR